MVKVKKESEWYLTPPKDINRNIQQTTSTFKLRMRSGVNNLSFLNKRTMPTNPPIPHQKSKLVPVVNLRPRIESRWYNCAYHTSFKYRNMHSKSTRHDIRHYSTPRPERYISVQKKQKTDESRRQLSYDFISPTADKIPADGIIGPPPLLVPRRFQYSEHLSHSETDKLQIPCLPIL